MKLSRFLLGLLLLGAGPPFHLSSTTSTLRMLQPVGAHSQDHHDGDYDHRCATAEPTLRDELIEGMRFQGAFGHDNNNNNNNEKNRRLIQTDCDQLCDQCIEIGVNLHMISANVTGLGVIIPHPTNTVLDLVNGRPGRSREDLSTPEDIIALFQANMAVVNRSFRGTPFRFTFTPEQGSTTITTTVNNDWSNYAVDFLPDMSQAVGSGDLRQLDVFVAWNLRQRTNGTTTDDTSLILGKASLPAAQLATQGDGVLLRYDVLTGGGLSPNDYGYTLIHEIGTFLSFFQRLSAFCVRDGERGWFFFFGGCVCFSFLSSVSLKFVWEMGVRLLVSFSSLFFSCFYSYLFSGHWLGLFHTFQQLVTTEACDPDEESFSDFVVDTPIQDGPSSRMARSCTEFLGLSGRQLPDTCPDLPGNDPIFNYMNYVDDERCQEEQGEFTCGQIERMYRHWLLFRDLVNTCQDPNDMQIEVVVEIDVDYARDTIILLEDERGNIIFNSIEDHLLAAIIFDQEAFLFDLCAPRNENYLLSIGDRSNNGFMDGSVVIYIDRVLLTSVSGNFGRFVTVPIAAQDVPPTESTTASSPTPAPVETPTPIDLGVRPSNIERVTQSPVASPNPSTSATEYQTTPTKAPTKAPTEAPTEVPTEGPPTMLVDESEKIEEESGASNIASLGGTVMLCCIWLIGQVDL